MSAAAVMMRDFTYCHPRDVLQDVLSIMKKRGFVHIPISIRIPGHLPRH
jgi:predicted transcriptional regulator